MSWLRDNNTHLNGESMSDVKEFEGASYKLVESTTSGMCDGCAFNDNHKSCRAIQEIGDCGNQIYKQAGEPIKPIDEHEWNDVGVRGVEEFDGYLIISTATDSLRVNRADADAMSAHFKRKAEG